MILKIYIKVKFQKWNANLPSKRARKSPEKIQVSKEDLDELSQTAKPDVDTQSVEETESIQMMFH